MHPVERLLIFLAPHLCVGCGVEGDVLCADCSDSVKPLPVICYACGRATGRARPCHNCLGKYKPQHVWIYTTYNGLIKEFLHAYKFESRRQAAMQVANLLDDVLPYFAHEPLVTYVPTAPLRRRERGFDQTELIAKELAHIRKWHVATLIARQKRVRQLGANREERKKQLNDAFRAVNLGLIKDQYILLVDDIVTTGATIEACTKVLKQSGASLVDAAVFARTPKK